MCTANNSRKNTAKRNKPKNNSDNNLRMMLPMDFTPSAKDILCGRGNVFSNHEGNQYFGRIIRSSIREYVNASNRPEKIRVVDNIHQKIRASGARFCKVDNENKRWYELNDVQAHQKIGHAIRDTIRLLEKDTKKTEGSEQLTTMTTSKAMKRSTIGKRKMLEQKRQARNNTMRFQSLPSPSPSSLPSSSQNHMRTASDMRTDAMEDILRLSLNAVDSLDLLGHDSFSFRDQQQLVFLASVTPTPPQTTTTIPSPTTGTTKSAPMYLLENEYPELDFDFSATSFFGDHLNESSSPDKIISFY